MSSYTGRSRSENAVTAKFHETTAKISWFRSPSQVKEHIKDPHHKASAKHRAMHSADSPSGSDSSYEDELLARSKQRNLVAMSRKSKSQLRGGKCTSSVCLEAAVASLESRCALRDPVWDRKKTLVLLDASAHVPSNADIRYAIRPPKVVSTCLSLVCAFTFYGKQSIRAMPTSSS